jgi:hypothetical protein
MWLLSELQPYWVQPPNHTAHTIEERPQEPRGVSTRSTSRGDDHNSGTLSPTPGVYRFRARMFGVTLMALERKIGVRTDTN